MTLVAVPLRVVDDWRLRAWSYVLDALTREQFVVAAADAPGEEWCKARAVGSAIGRRWSSDDVLVLHDADVRVAPEALRAAIDVVARGEAAWAVPHGKVYRLDETATVEVYEGADPWSYGRMRLTRWPYQGVAGGGVTVVRSDVYDDCPLDPRFRMWGSEDESAGVALATLHGAPWRGDAGLIHLWHPHAAPGARRSPRLDSERLRRAYLAYRDDPEKMRVLVDSARSAYAPRP